MKKAEVEGRVPSYMASTSSSRMKHQLPVKKEAVEPRNPKRKRLTGNDDPDCVVASIGTKAPQCVQGAESVRTSTGDEKRRPHYLSSTASLDAKKLPTRPWTKPESRLPPRMVVIKQVSSPPRRRDAVLPNLTAISSGPQEAAPVSSQSDLPVKTLEEATPVPVEIPSINPIISSGETVKHTPEESSSGTPKKSISTSPERGTSLPAKEEKKSNYEANSNPLFLL